MPQVGKKKFPYTKEGKAMAEAYAKAQGKKSKKGKRPASVKKMNAQEMKSQRGY
jgi:hypothetical protein